LAAREHSLEALPAALEYGADVNARDVNGLTPAHYAVQEDAVPILIALLDAGSDINAIDIHGNTLLHIAASRGSARICRLLLWRKANPNLRNDQGKTPLQVIGRGVTKLGDSKLHGDIETPITLAKSRNLQEIRLLLESKR